MTAISYSADAARTAGAVLVGVVTLPLTALAHAVSSSPEHDNACVATVESATGSAVIPDDRGKDLFRRLLDGIVGRIGRLFD